MELLWLISAALLPTIILAQHDSHEAEHDSHEADHDDHETSKVLGALGITALSGCAALLGFCFVLCLNRDRIGLIPISLGFSSGVIVYLTLMNLFPECIELFLESAPGEPAMARFYGSLCVIGGLALSLMMERVIPHSHAHEHPAAAPVADLELADRPQSDPEPDLHAVQPEMSESGTHLERQASLPRVSYSIAAALILHHLPEGMMAFMSLYHKFNFGILVSFALAIHDLPSGICIALPMYVATGSKKKPFLLCLLAAFAYFLGGIMGWLLILAATDDEGAAVKSTIAAMFGITSGVMLYVAFVELLPTAIVAANRHRETTKIGNQALGDSHPQGTRIYKATIASIFLGFVVMEIGNIMLASSGGHSH